MRRVYMDWNATTPPLERVVEVMAEAARGSWANPASVHAFGRQARAIVEDARAAIAALARCDARDVVLTSGGTEANNLALRGRFDASRKGAVLATSRLEHPSVTRVADSIERSGACRVRWLRVTAAGTIDLEDLERVLIEDRPALVATQSVNSETGVVQPVGQVLRACKASGIPVHVDSIQAFGRLEDVAADADTRSLAAHKMRGPKSIGALIVKPGTSLAPVLFGGSQERGIRPGTVDPVGAAGLAEAARHALTGPARWRAIAPLRDRLEAGLRRIDPLARIIGESSRRAPHVSTLAFSSWSGPELVAALDLEGVAVSSGSACSAGTAEPSPAVAAMFDARTAAAAVRFSLGEDTTLDDVEYALAAAERVLRRRAPGD